MIRVSIAYQRKFALQRRNLSTKNEIVEKFSRKIASLENEQRRFEYEYQQKLGAATVPLYAPKSSKEFAESKPWTGEENAFDSSRRMLEDSVKPLKMSKSQRLTAARENVLDYTLNKEEGETYEERVASTRKKRRMGAGMSSGLSSGGWIESVAAMEIENAAAQGQFRDIRRGKDAAGNLDGLLEANRNPQLDFTEHLLNNIIKKQGGAPPWIMKQQAVRDRVSEFRERIHRRLQERLVHKLADLTRSNVNDAVQLAHSGVHNRDEEWENQYQKFHQESIEDINRQIRGYNLIAPQSARKGYLYLDTEIERCYRTVTEGIEEELAKYFGILSIPKADRNTLHASVPPLESPDKHYGLRRLFRDLFSRSST